MATALIPEIINPGGPATTAVATLRLVVSPLRGPDGKLRVHEVTVPAGQTITEALPAEQVWGHLILNGRVIAPEERARVSLLPGDELLAFPQWGDPISPWLIPLAIGLAVSIATTALSYVLFPPAKPHIQQAVDEPTFSFEGIRTAIGPGNVVPVIYGRHRVGGQLLSASVDQVMTVRDSAGGTQRVEALSSPPTLTMLLALGEGPLSVILTNTIEINGQPIANFPSVQTFTRLGDATQTPIPEFGETASTFADGREIDVLPGVIYTTTQAVQAFVLNIAFQEGLFVLTAKGEKHDNVTTLGYRYRVSPAGTWSEYSYFDVAAARTSVVRFGIRREDLTLAVYDVQVVFSHAYNVDDVRAKWMATLESVTEILHNTSAYPNTALLGLRTVATDAMQGALPNITVEVLGRSVRVNELLPNLNWSDNPAWCVMDLMTNGRYGLGYPDSVIDFPAFQAWGAYCSQLVDGEARHTLNYVLDREQRAQPLLLEMCGASRVLLLKSEGLWSPRITQNDLPVQLFSWANVTNLKLTYTRDPDRVSVMEGRFTNEEQGFESDVVTWPAVQNWPSDVRKASLDLRGITKPSRVIRALQFELNRRRFEVLTLEMDCAPDAIVMQVHDVFRLSHPLPGWGTSGRIMPGTTADIVWLDTPVTCEGGKSYHLYVRYQEDTVEVRPVVFPGVGEFDRLQVFPPLGGVPEPEISLWAFGESSPVDTAVRLFRVVRMARNPDNTVHISATVHNPTIYDEPEGIPLPVITSLFNPLGPAPPIISLVLMEVTRVEPSGASLRVVNLSWDVEPLSSGYAPYGGATIFRRTVLVSGLGGTQQAGFGELGAIQDPSDANVGFVPLVQVRGHVLDFDDYTVTTGSTYVYRVVPISQRGVPNNTGAREGVIHVSGPTTPGFFPGTPSGLRLKGKSLGDTIFEGRNIELEWDPPVGTLFNETFFLQDYIVEVWIPGQVALLRRTIVPAKTAGQLMEWTYTLEQNTEDSVAAGYGGAQRHLTIMVWGRTNTNRVSLTPASITVMNPPPDMSSIIPAITPLMAGLLIRFDQYAEPRDFDHYELYVDTLNPPLTIYNNIAIAFTGQGSSIREVPALNLAIGVTYYVYVMPYDTFGPGLASQIASGVPVGVGIDTLDTVPPATPTGLTLSTGTDTSDDGTIIPWVQADWDLNTESDMARYETHWRLDNSTVPSVFTVSHPTTKIRHPNVPGNTTVHVRMLAEDGLANASPFTAEVSITTGADTLAPFAPTGLTATPTVQRTHLLWSPPPDADYDYAEVWASATNDRTTATRIGTGAFSFLHDNLGVNQTWYYWVRAVDTSGNLSTDYFPPSATAGIAATTGQLDNQYISALSADKITAGTLDVVVRLAVNGIVLDGVNNLITVFDAQVPPVPRVYLGKLGALQTQYGMQLFNDAGDLMWSLTTGATPEGIEDAAVTGAKIRVGALQASHLSASTLFITNVAQLGTAVITTAHIQDAAIQTAKIGDAQIIAAKIQNANILRAHIQDLAVNDAKIENLVADKILAGILQATYRIGVGDFITLDGPNHLITIRDAANTVRVFLGQVASDYGLQVFNAGGFLMWDFTSGAQTRGIAPNAVSNTIAYQDVTGGSTSSATDVSLGFVVFPTLVTGDVVLLFLTATAASSDTLTATVGLHADTAAGTHINSSSQSMPRPAEMIAINGVHMVTGGTFTNRQYHVTARIATGTGTVALSDVVLIGLRLQR